MPRKSKYQELFERSKAQGNELQKNYFDLRQARITLEKLNKLCALQQSRINHLRSVLIAVKILVRSVEKKNG